MTKAEYLEICSQHWEDMENLHCHDNLYDFEKEYVQMPRELARKSFEGILGNLPTDHRKKTFTTSYGKISIDNRHALSGALTGFKLSPYLKERVLFLGQEVFLENASELIEEVMGISVSDTTIHRVVERYGEQAQPHLYTRWKANMNRFAVTRRADNLEFGKRWRVRDIFEFTLPVVKLTRRDLVTLTIGLDGKG